MLNRNYELLYLIKLNFYLIQMNLDLSSTCQYVTAFIKRINYYHHFSKSCIEAYSYNQELITEYKNKDVEDSDNFIIIKCCHDSIKITKNKITFYERDTYDNIICKLLPCLNYSSNQILIRVTPCIISFTYPIAINFQLFDLILNYSIDNNMNIYPYCIFDYVYNFNSSFFFLIIMLNTSKSNTLPNCRYEYVMNR
ncbi:hypothetical protein BCR36DRAFT_369743 [Piromyces finnis]|uniref:Uncharacterized protein n=1 Tax=Piromyces finnis TaxID=1754191 RepID=A0A1Y1VBK0_9FUNG|nr:hypothetical protein BCR36DRAFT_369743 [Piromyces finnis]|eukprot:ORX51835.1 hypothetical protein BCR36DRAFT_369743 [Piromyces finnis]